VRRRDASPPAALTARLGTKLVFGPVINSVEAREEEITLMLQEVEPAPKTAKKV
jgi:hypothetical protein